MNPGESACHGPSTSSQSNSGHTSNSELPMVVPAPKPPTGGYIINYDPNWPKLTMTSNDGVPWVVSVHPDNDKYADILNAGQKKVLVPLTHFHRFLEAMADNKRSNDHHTETNKAFMDIFYNFFKTELKNEEFIDQIVSGCPPGKTIDLSSCLDMPKYGKQLKMDTVQIQEKSSIEKLKEAQAEIDSLTTQLRKESFKMKNYKAAAIWFEFKYKVQGDSSARLKEKHLYSLRQIAAKHFAELNEKDKLIESMRAELEETKIEAKVLVAKAKEEAYAQVAKAEAHAAQVEKTNEASEKELQAAHSLEVAKCNKLVKENNALREEKFLLVDEYNMQWEENKKLMGENDALVAEKNELIAGIEHFNEKIGQLLEKNDQLDLMINELCKNNELLTGHNKELTDRNNELTGTIKAIAKSGKHIPTLELADELVDLGKAATFKQGEQAGIKIERITQKWQLKMSSTVQPCLQKYDRRSGGRAADDFPSDQQPRSKKIKLGDLAEATLLKSCSGNTDEQAGKGICDGGVAAHVVAFPNQATDATNWFREDRQDVPTIKTENFDYITN